MEGLGDLINQGYNNGATFATQIGGDLQLLGYGTDYFPQYAPQPVTGIDLGGNPEPEKYLTQVKDGYVLYSSTFGSNEDDGDGDAAGVGDGDAAGVGDGDAAGVGTVTRWALVTATRVMFITVI